jgi:hypothetical protein
MLKIMQLIEILSRHEQSLSTLRTRCGITPELTGREHTAFNIIGEDNDENKAVERSG